MWLPHPSIPSASQRCTDAFVNKTHCVRATGMLFCYSLTKRHLEISPSTASALTTLTTPCSYPIHCGFCDCLWSKPADFVTVLAAWGVLGFFLVFLVQYFKWNAEVLIREEWSFSGFHCSAKKPKRRGKKWEHSQLMAREMKYLISKILYVQGGLPQPPTFFLGRN